MSRTSWALVAGSILLALVLVAGFVMLLPALSMLFDPARVHNYYIPSESMLPTLNVGDRIRPLRVAPADLKRGMVIVFTGPAHVSVDRIAALPATSWP